ncbi:HAMP domain-containing histidine kinase [Alteromonadaceae bacterium M269]|nr:HAMP domain-containing histidine kinase [Alteromonadaceae bacterium M269]
MKFYQRLDWQLAIIIVLTFIISITVTGVIRPINVSVDYLELTDQERKQIKLIYDQIRDNIADNLSPEELIGELSRTLNTTNYTFFVVPNERDRLADSTMTNTHAKPMQKDIDGTLVFTTELEVLADSTKNNTRAKHIQKNTDGTYVVILGSFFYKKIISLAYSNLDSLAFEDYVIVIAPNHLDKIKAREQRKVDHLYYEVYHHIYTIGLYYLFILVFIFAFIRWRLRPLRNLEEKTQLLSSSQIPSEIPNTGFNDEVGSLVKSFNFATQKLREEDKRKGQMLAEIAHELRTPLNNLQGRLEAQQTGIIDDKDDVLSFSYKHVHYLSHLVEDIDLITTVDYGEFMLNLEGHNIRPIIDEECKLLNLQYPFEWEIKGIDLKANVDILRFRQVIKNILQNASTAKSIDLKVFICLFESQGNCILTIEDNGPGVPQDNLEKIFERLYRVDESRNAKTGGSGLGLHIVRKLIQLHNGDVNAYLSETGGLGIRIKLPI